MTGCLDCGRQTPNRRCRDCQRDRYWEDVDAREADEADEDQEPDWKLAQQALDGGRPSGQSTLDGGIQSPGGDD